jgi:hypothetical protein
MDIEHNRAILAVCASNSIRDSVQGLPHNVIKSLNRVWHTLTLAAVETPLIYEFVRESIQDFELRRRLNNMHQPHAASPRSNTFAFPI